jgi:hypothetical protein
MKQMNKVNKGMWKDAGENGEENGKRNSLVAVRPLPIMSPIAHKPKRFFPYSFPLPAK